MSIFQNPLLGVSRTTWRYTAQLIALFVIAAGAAYMTIDYLQEHGRVPTAIILALWGTTIGFMFLAGGLGIWAIQFSAEAESRRRIGRVVDGMDYLSDGLLAVDRRGQVSGFNPAARAMSAVPPKGGRMVWELFPCLSEEDVRLLLDARGPGEFQRDTAEAGGVRTLRFRSQLSDGANLIQVSDVTAMESRERRKRQTARLQLIGRIARGVAHDFNNILCVISGHASLLGRRPLTPDMKESVGAIMHETQRAGQLASNLMELSHSGLGGKSAARVREDIDRAVQLLKVGLASGWEVRTELAAEYPPVALSGVQVEQIVLNLGLFAADALGEAGVLRIQAAPAEGPPGSPGMPGALELVISSMRTEGRSAPPTVLSEAELSEEEGVISSVVRSMLEETGGRFEFLKGAGGVRIYRVVLPNAVEPALPAGNEGTHWGSDLKPYLNGWRVVSAGTSRIQREFDRRLAELGVTVESLDTVVAALSVVHEARRLDAFIVDRALLGSEADGLLRAVAKLCPDTGIVVLADEVPEHSPLQRDAIFETRWGDAYRIARALIEAKALAARRPRAG